MTRKITHNNSTYRITLTKHVIERILNRNIPHQQILHTIFSVIDKINNGNVLIENALYNFSLVLYVKDNHIKLITAIDKVNCWIKPDTQVLAV